MPKRNLLTFGSIILVLLSLVPVLHSLKCYTCSLCRNVGGLFDCPNHHDVCVEQVQTSSFANFFSVSTFQRGCSSTCPVEFKLGHVHNHFTCCAQDGCNGASTPKTTTVGFSLIFIIVIVINLYCFENACC